MTLIHGTESSLPGLEHASDAAICVHDLTVAYDGRPVLWDIDLDFPTGSFAGVIGPNGAGKSTLLKAILGQVPTTSGRVLVHGASFESQRRLIGYVPQRESVDWDFPVRAVDVVAMGAYARLGWCRSVSREVIDEATHMLARVGMESFALRQIGRLSGGQQQRIFLARALMQRARVYLLDEPFASVDAATEQVILEVLHQLRQDGATIIAVHHDLATAAHAFDWCVLLNMRVVAAGPTPTTLTNANLAKTYGGRLTILSEAADALRAAARRGDS
ncbi:MAG: ABC transporter ATP-binding protein [Planctomycetota bacterium]|nr:ABC transporter ATP-binding protein [Planctomycetota bacterium]